MTRFTRRRFLDTACKCLGVIGIDGALDTEAAAGTLPDAPPIHPPSSALDAAIAREIGSGIVATDRILLDAPDVAENGAIVPITVETSLPDAHSVAVFVEKNPVPLAARFQFQPELDAYVSLRIKMNESSDVVAVVNSGGTFYAARKMVRVVIGGCG